MTKLISIFCLLALTSAIFEAMAPEQEPKQVEEPHQQAQTHDKWVQGWTHKSVNYMNENGI